MRARRCHILAQWSFLLALIRIVLGQGAREDTQAKQKVIATFLHIPKTAGKAVAFAITKGCVSTTAFTQVEAQTWASMNGTQFFLNAIEAANSNSDNHVFLLARHTLMKIGYLEEHIHNDNAKMHYFFFLREPKERVLSAYFDLYHSKCKPKSSGSINFNGCSRLDPLVKWINVSQHTIAWGRGNEMTSRIAAQLTKRPPETDAYEKALAAHGLALPYSISSPEEALKEAISIIEGKKKDANGNNYHISFGITEKWAESITIVLEEIFPDCKLAKWLLNNQNNIPRPHFNDLPLDIAAAVKESTQLDSVLYEAALKQYRKGPLVNERKRALKRWQKEFIEEQQKFNTENRYAWIIAYIVHGNHTLEATLTLIQSLKRVNTTADIVIVGQLVPKTSPLTAPYKLFTEMGCRLMKLQYPRRMSSREKLILAKLSSPLFDIYKKVIFLDTEQIVLANIDHFFEDYNMLTLRIPEGSVMVFEHDIHSHQEMINIFQMEDKNNLSSIQYDRIKISSAEGIAYHYFKFIRKKEPEELPRLVLRDIWNYQRHQPWLEDVNFDSHPLWRQKRLQLWWQIYREANTLLQRTTDQMIVPPSWVNT